MGEPDRKRRKYHLERSVNPGPGPPAVPRLDVQADQHKDEEHLHPGESWALFHSCVESLNQCLITRCICHWRLEDYENVLIVSATKLAESDNCSEVLLFCSAVQLMCEEIARQNSIENRGNTYCQTLKRLKVLLFHVNSISDPTCLLQHFLRSANQYTSYAAARALSAWLKAADEGACRVLLDRLLNNIVS